MTFTINVGDISISAPATADVGSGAPGDTIGPTAFLSAVTVADDQAQLDGSWAASVSSSGFVTGTAPNQFTIAAGQASYDPGTVTTGGPGVSTIATHVVTLSSTPTPAVNATAVTGDNTATWTPSITVIVPANAAAGLYTATVTHSVV